MGTFIIASQFLLSLSLLIVLHEYGHFQTARWFGMRVEKFYLFFNPWYSVYKKQVGETEYGIGWLPLGGYVKISGMMDESMDKEQLAQEPKPWEFRSKPAWQRLIVMLGGVFVNLVLGFFIYAMLIWTYGREYLPNASVLYGIEIVDTLACKQIGLEAGDKILKIGEQPFEQFNPGILLQAVVIDGVNSLEIERQGQKQTLSLSRETRDLLTNYRGALFTYRMPFVIKDLDEKKKGAAAQAGLEAGDSLVSIDGQEAIYFAQGKRLLEARKGQEIEVTYYRQGQLKQARLTLNEQGQMGIYPKGLEMNKEAYGFLEAFPAGFEQGMKFLWGNLMGLKAMIVGDVDATKGLGGLISIAKVFPSYWDWEIFWSRTAALSLILGMMNLLPIPALDGGHALFTLFEIVLRRPLPPKFLEYTQMLGVLFLLSLLLFANGLDIYRSFFGG